MAPSPFVSLSSPGSLTDSRPGLDSSLPNNLIFSSHRPCRVEAAQDALNAPLRHVTSIGSGCSSDALTSTPLPLRDRPRPSLRASTSSPNPPPSTQGAL